MHKKFLNEIKNEEKNINDQIFNKYFYYKSQSFLGKNLYENNQNKK